MDYVMGVDIAAEGTTAAIYDRDMTEIASAFEESRLQTSSRGAVWQEASDIYGSVLRTIRMALRKSGIRPSNVAAVGLDSQMAGLMGIGEDGEAVTYYDSWLDTRCEDYRRQMSRRAGKRIIEITGGPVSYNHGPKILWWKQEQPEAYQKICKFVLPHAYAAGKMAGLRGPEAYFDYTGLQYSGFGDNQKKEWSQELLRLFEVPADKCARIVSPFDLIGNVTRETSKACGLVQGTPIAAGLGDTAAEIFSAGIIQKGGLLDCAGTASVLCCAMDRFAPDTKYETMTMMRSPVDGLWYPLAYINGGGFCLSWFKKEFTGRTRASYRTLDREAEKIPAGSDGILFIPHFDGRVLPNNPYMKGSFLGLDWKHTRAHLYHAVMEGIAYEYAYYLKILKELYPSQPFNQMKCIGGGAKSPQFMQVKADVLGVEVTGAQSGISPSAGTAVVAGTAAGLFADYRMPLKPIAHFGPTLPPDPEKHETYKTYAETYLKALDALTGIYKRDLYHR